MITPSSELQGAVSADDIFSLICETVASECVSGHRVDSFRDYETLI
jgi:hypothetical protein